MFPFLSSLLLLFAFWTCHSISQALVSSCSGVTDHAWNSEKVSNRLELQDGTPAWNSENVPGKLESWMRSGVTTQGEGEVSSKLFNRKDNEFTEHIANVNDKRVEDIFHEFKSWYKWRMKLLNMSPEDDSHKSEEEEDQEKFDDDNPIFNTNDKSVVTIGKFINGLPSGLVWQWRSRRFEDGFLYGYVNQKGKFTGENITYIYPDLKSGFRGTFQNGNMMAGVEVKITGERCKGGIKELRIETVEKRKSIVWKREDLNSTYIGRHPTVRDPYERRGTYIGQSAIPGSGQGVFAKKPFAPGQLVMYLSGLKVNVRDIYRPYMSREERNIAGSYAFEFGKSFPGFNNHVAIDIPPRYRHVHTYSTTLGHKVNHNFKETNTEWGFVRHPSHGPVVSLVAIEPIAKDQEIFVNYHYNLEAAPQWYKDQATDFQNIA